MAEANYCLKVEITDLDGHQNLIIKKALISGRRPTSPL